MAETLDEFIVKHYSGNKAAFARANGVLAQQVTQWINSGFIVVDGVLYSQRRELKKAT